ncbi:MAG: GHKL domain-containing protein [Paraclostridium bifermentans]|uniref:sensor histidine kinase n=1 Tax=Paraclostridium bifermentans TaxID=1490 RepID=UPI001DE523AE|nr:sensor histidine kinase [Paraclostridium bifermentans]MBS6506723.1 GHKL domain-containing protein [Paraclostridium bifermentans]
MLENNFIYILIILISSAIELTTLSVLLNEFVELKSNKKNIINSLIIFIIITSICEVIAMIIILKSNWTIEEASLWMLVVKFVKSIVSTTLISIFIKINYKIEIKKIVLISISYILFLGLLNEIIYAFLSLLCNRLIDMEYGWYYTLLYQKLIFLEVNILTKLLLIYIVTVIKTVKLKVNLNNKQYKYIFFSIILNLLSAILIFATIYKTTQSVTDFALDFVIALISSSILILNIFFMWLIIRVSKDSNLRAENKCIKENIQLQHQYYLNMQESQMKVKKLYHDMKNHMICIENLYGKNEYVESINNQLKECNSIFNTNNMILDIILNDKKRICESKGIDLIANINFKECNFIDSADVCSIFSNMIDNAIEACENIEDNSISKKINIKGTIVKSLYIIKCENPKNNIIKLKSGKILTNKKDKFLHGIGISSMKNSIEKYNGNLEVNDLNTRFLINICIPLKPNENNLYIKNA